MFNFRLAESWSS